MKITLLHGALGSGSQLQPMAEEFSNRGICTEILELPGHGENNDTTEDFSIKYFSKWLEETIDKKGLWNDPFFGFSMGGYIMLYLLSTLSKPKIPVITLGTKFHWTPGSAQAEVRHLNPDKIIEKVPDFAELLNQRHHDWREVLMKTRNLMLNLGEIPLLDESTVSNIQNRVKIMRGGADKMVSKEESEMVAGYLRNGFYSEIPDEPHPLEKIDIKKVCDEIEKFIYKES